MIMVFYSTDLKKEVDSHCGIYENLPFFRRKTVVGYRREMTKNNGIRCGSLQDWTLPSVPFGLATLLTLFIC